MSLGFVFCITATKNISILVREEKKQQNKHLHSSFLPEKHVRMFPNSVNKQMHLMYPVHIPTSHFPCHQEFTGINPIPGSSAI